MTDSFRTSLRQLRPCAGFTTLEVMVAAVLLFVCMGGFISACYVLNRIQLDNDPKVRGHEAHLELMKANAMLDVRSSDASFAFAGYLRLNGAALRSTTWTTIAAPDYPPIATNASAVQSALTAGYAGLGQTLTLTSAPGQQSVTTLLCLRSDGRIKALWEILNAQITIGGVAGLETTITRYADEGGATLQAAALYQQFIPGASLVSPGGASGSRALAGVAALSNGRVRITFPAPQAAGELLAMSGSVKPESASAAAATLDLQAIARPQL